MHPLHARHRGEIVALVAAGKSRDEILALCPYLEPDDMQEALSYAAWRVQEHEVATNAP